MSVERHNGSTFYVSRHGRHDDPVLIHLHVGRPHLVQLPHQQFPQFELTVTAGVATGFFHRCRVDFHVLQKTFEQSFCVHVLFPFAFLRVANAIKWLLVRLCGD